MYPTHPWYAYISIPSALAGTKRSRVPTRRGVALRSLRVQSCRSKKLAREAEVQPLVALVLGIGDIVALLLLAHSRPLRLLLLVPPHVVDLRAHEQHNRQDVDADEGFVAAVIERFVVCAVDVRGDDRSGLHAHVVEGGGDGACADGAGVARAERYVDRVGVWCAQQDGEQSEGCPCAAYLTCAWPPSERNQTR